MNKTPQTTVRVRFQDCDPYNHLNNSKYLDYFINAREDQLIEHYGIDVFDHVKTTGTAWVVASNQILYLKPALVMEEVIIGSKLIAFDSKRLTVEMFMWNKDKTELKSVLWVKFLHCDFVKNKAADHAEDLMRLFEQIVVPLETQVFEERCAVLMQQARNGIPA